VFYVLGEVNSPGAYPISGRETVLDAILAAGGVTDAADLGGITFTRPSPPNECRVVLPVCYREIVQLGDTATNYQVGPGDRIYVPSMSFSCRSRRFSTGVPVPSAPRAACLNSRASTCRRSTFRRKASVAPQRRSHCRCLSRPVRRQSKLVDNWRRLPA